MDEKVMAPGYAHDGKPRAAECAQHLPRVDGREPVVHAGTATLTCLKRGACSPGIGSPWSRR